MAGSKEPEQNKTRNDLSEAVIDFEKNIIINRGTALLLMIEKDSLKKSGIVLPDSVDQSEFMYYKVIRRGNEDYLEKNPDMKETFRDDKLTEVGNVIISVRPGPMKIYTNGGNKYLILAEHLVDAQVNEKFFKP